MKQLARPAAAGRTRRENYRGLRKSNLDLPVKPIPCALVRWPHGFGGPVLIYPFGNTEDETENIRALIETALAADQRPNP